MGKYVARRVLLILPTLLLVTMFVFLLMRVLPGDVAQSILGEQRTQESLEILRTKLGLDRPLYTQYLTWLWDMARGDFGESIISGRSIAEEIVQRAPISFQLSLMAMVFGFVVGICLGVLSAIRQNSWLDFVLRFVSICFLAAPSFWVGLVVIFVGAYVFNWMPPLGYHPLWEDPRGNLTQLIWPAMILGLYGTATQARMGRSTMLEVMREDYIRTARAKGLREWTVILRHALKNALIPNVTMAGLTFAVLLGGSVILESIFAIPGMGTYLINGIREHDYTVVQGVTAVFAVAVMVVNLIIDLLYGWLDPRISYN
ncbi:MAG: ABC transporter permease [Chloroflexota bacterium]